MRYEIIIIERTINDQIAKFLKNCFDPELDLKNPGRIKIKTAIKKNAGISCSNATINYSKNLSLFEKIFLYSG
tara:strand:- start:290 stop:508 length:219 start_codon:yes stop_codon:yes gene_type:complete